MTSLAPRRKLGQNPPFMDERLVAWTKQVEAYAVEEGDGWLAITVIVKFF